MLIWDNDPACEIGSVSSLDLAWTPTSLSQLRALVALYLARGLEREDLERLAGVADGPSLTRGLHEVGFYMPRDKTIPFVLIGSIRGGVPRIYRRYLGQYWLTAHGRKVLDLLRSPAAKFRRKVAGFESIADALNDCGALFGHMQIHEWKFRIGRHGKPGKQAFDPLCKLWRNIPRESFSEGIESGNARPVWPEHQLAINGRLNWSKAEAACLRRWTFPALG